MAVGGPRSEKGVVRLESMICLRRCTLLALAAVARCGVVN
jgi:hypothetical protein